MMDLKIFVGLQFASTYYSKVLMDGYIDDAVRQVNDELRCDTHRETSGCRMKWWI